MKITLINPPMPYLINDKACPPLGLMYLGAVLREAGYSTEIIDLASTPEENWRIPKGSNYYGITAATPQYKYACQVRDVIRQETPETPIVIGGPHPSALAESVLADDFDYVVVGEGEKAIQKIVADQCPPGIVAASPPDDLDELPFPARDMVDIFSYSPAMQSDRVTTIATSRGCPYKCAYCCKKVFSNRMRFRSPENVLAEIEEVRDKYGINAFVFIDDTFTLSKPRLTKMCAVLHKAGVTWRCHTRVDQVDREILKMLSNSGCTEISFGIESGSQKVLDRISKGTTVDQNISALLTAKDVGLITKMYIGFGWPGDNHETLEETKNFIDFTKPDQCLMNTFVPLPGSDIWDNPSKYGLKNLNPDFSKYYFVGHEGKGQVVFETNQLTSNVIEELRDDLIIFLQQRNYIKN